MRVKCHKCEMDTRVKYYSTRVTWNFTREVHIYMLRETCSMQTRDVNSVSSCRVSMRVYAPGFEVIIELYCIYVRTYVGTTVPMITNAWIAIIAPKQWKHVLVDYN